MIFRCGTYIGVIALLALPLPIFAQTAAELQQQINRHNSQIDDLNKEIAQYQKQLDDTSSKKQTLQSTIANLNLNIKKLTASIKVTQNKIGSTQLEIQQLGHTIDDKQQSIEEDSAAVAESLRLLDQVEKITFISSVLSADSISSAWEDADSHVQFESAVRSHMDELAQEKKSLADTKSATEKKKAELVSQENNLVSQQGSLAATKKAQSDLLTQTKAQESNFQAILAQKQAAKANFESALTNLKTKLQYVVDASQITPAGQGVLKWPVDNVRVTQYFGNTPFAASGAYNGKGHNGIDLAASIGTPIHAALTGTIVGTGNTDAVRGCYSFGKWVMVKHGNGLSTMYAHLSQINVSQGQVVGTGELLGYSGETGYATGPHLHFGVYVSSATQILKLGEATQSNTPCANAVMPVTPITGYLNPLNYL